MSDKLLEVKNYSVASTDDVPILHSLNLTIKKGETHVLMGPNGAGKSTFGSSLLSNPAYKLTDGRVFFEDEDITDLPTDKRAKKGIFLSFQTPVEIPGISLYSFLRAAVKNTGSPLTGKLFRKKLNETLKVLDLKQEYLERDLNVGFSGGERKKVEMLQLLMLSSKLAILDETDSGLDVDAVNIMLKGINEFQQDKTRGLLIISHNMHILNKLKIDKVHILVKGHIVAEGGSELIQEINKDGFIHFETQAGDCNV
ncbi:Fe-S cluster assembly ATPase SufC [Pectinatus cerevisiiphilus]|uniref:Fe-S cluster assembly ATP-binding protein n=1 Tax=Pectinatus cerevisiiphilus TaxID=86956 RepID=A0A4R3KAF0_9FIRM|nr:Fe-S cluster assembly ATPase SufC [Pectinatus cerevisiiphilus]TCS79977.1 Fe-S cluster assembly ATP-binding protein [Pectinatus cerevisiiphilus]